jgi:hypothetical protein
MPSGKTRFLPLMLHLVPRILLELSVIAQEWQFFEVLGEEEPD